MNCEVPHGKNPTGRSAANPGCAQTHTQPGRARSRGPGRGVGGEEGAQPGTRTGPEGYGTEDSREKGRDEEKKWNLVEIYMRQM